MSKPAFLKTYGKQKHRLEKWFSPDLRKKVFSFSSTPSSDQSVSELPSRKRNKRNSTTSDECRSLRTAKRKAMEALKELDSDENSFIQENTPRRKPKPGTKLVKKAAVTRRSSGMHGFRSSKENHASQFTLRMRKQPVLTSSENDSDLFETKKKCSNACRQHSSSNFRRTKEGDSVVLPRVDGFVTKRRKVLRVQSEKQSFEQSLGNSSNALNTSKDFTSFPRYVTNRKPPTTQPEANMKPPVMFHSGTYNHSGTVLHEVSFNDVEEQMMSCKLPLLCSTPSLVSKRNVHSLEPSIIELSSLSCDEIDKPPSINESTVNDLMSKPQKHGMLRKSKECAKQIQKTEMENADDKNQTCSDGEVVSAGPHLKQLKERAVIMLEKLDVSDKLSNQSDDGKQEVEKTYSPSLEAASATAMLSRCGDQTSHMSSDYATSDRSTRASHLTTSLSPSSLLSVSSLSAPPAYEHSSSLQKQIDRLKVECLSSCLTVCLQRLDLRNIRQSHGEIIKTHETQVVSTPSLERGQNASNPNNLSCLVDTESGEQSSQGELRTKGLVRRLSTSFMLSAISPEPVTAPSKVPVSKERTGHCPSRKACVSGLNSSRWSRRGTSKQPRKQRHNETRTKPGDCSTNDLLPTGADSYTGESAYGWLQSRETGLPKTPLSVERLNLSSFLTSFTPDSLTTHTWGRLKAALSIHKKKTAIPTPQRLALSNLKYSGLVDTSLDLFGTPASAHPLCSRITNVSMFSCNEDISDAEKVYQECQQEGPVSFDDCIPPESMKHCIKIGEGTFGEVFSVVNDADQTVALKLIPVEGQEKVNGEPQKSLGEVLHEIIISKELSALNTKEHNQTNGFIGLINLHCVRGCYPSALLNAWDKFDQEKGSENDRPDFFDKEQLFLILEFEFGGTDLENLNGKLISMAQAKSVLHQVTAALAVAEEALCFEHRDLHWGNILLKNTKQKHNQFILNGSVQSVETRGVHVNIIDYSLSRLEIDGLTVSCDIANEEELFMGQGDYQFEVYRLMKKENNNCWTVYKPHSNVLWLHYLTDKLLNMRYRNKPKTSQQKALKGSLKSFHSEVLNYHSAKDVLMNAPLFQ